MTRIVGLGLDMVELARLESILDRHGARFINRFCRPGEARRTSGRSGVQHLGGLFAAKEAVMKALGTGWSQGVAFRDIEVVRLDGGERPGVRLHGAAGRRGETLGVERVHLTITHERSMAAAVAVLEGRS